MASQRRREGASARARSRGRGGSRLGETEVRLTLRSRVSLWEGESHHLSYQPITAFLGPLGPELICSSLIVNEVEKLFICLLAICILSVNAYSCPLPHYSVRLFLLI